jgi:hypothetical protein
MPHAIKQNGKKPFMNATPIDLGLYIIKKNFHNIQVKQGLNGKLILTTETVNLFFSFLVSFDLNYFDMNKPRLV